MTDRPTAFEAAWMLAAAIAGREPFGGLTELRWKTPHGMRQEFVNCHEPQQVAATALGYGKDTDVYVGISPRRERSGTAGAVERAWLLAADCDTGEAVEALRRFRPRPSIVVRSGGQQGDTGSPNCHGYWQLQEPITPTEAVEAKQRLAHALGSDPQVSDTARVMRVPGTVNTKYAPPATATCVLLELTTFTVEEVVGHLAPLEEVSAKSYPVRRFEDDDPLRAVPPRVYVEALAGVDVGRDDKIRCPFHADDTPSLHVYDEPDRGWYCYGCGRGGRIYEFAAELWGTETRGAEFRALRVRLAEVLLGSRAA